MVSEQSIYENMRFMFLCVTFKCFRSFLQKWNLTLAEKICSVYGGYVVEIDDQAEFDFLVNFTSANNITNDVFIGITDRGHEGSWVYLTSDLPVTFTKWWGGTPTIHYSQSCAYISYRDKLMRDYVCEASSARYRDLFVCEMPE